MTWSNPPRAEAPTGTIHLILVVGSVLGRPDKSLSPRDKG